MAKNWKVGEAIVAIKSGNKEDIVDIGRRFPLFAVLAAQVNDAGTELLNCVPDYCTARKIESVLKTGVAESSDTDVEDEAGSDVEEEVEVEAKPAKPAKAPRAKKADKAKAAEEEGEVENELDTKSAKELYDMCVKAGLKVMPKKDKEVYIAALKKAAEPKAVEVEDDWGDEEEDAPKAKPQKAPKAAKAEKPAKAAKVEADDEDWDI